MRASPIIEFFVRHKTASNLLMILMLVLGLASLDRLNRQFFPDFAVDVIAVSINWTGATAEDVDANIVQLLEPELRAVSNVKKVNSNSYDGRASVQVEFEFNTDMQKALADVESAVGQVDLPQSSERPRIIHAEFDDPVSKLVISGPFSIAALRVYAKDIKEDLQRLGVDKVSISGLPDEVIKIEISQTELANLGLSLNQIAERVRATSTDVPGGTFAGGALAVRSLGLRRTAEEYKDIEIQTRPDGSRVTLDDIATISESFEDPHVAITRNGRTAVAINIMRSKSDDSLVVNDTVNEWLADYRSRAPQSLNIEQYDIQADLIKQRIGLLAKNGAFGLVLVLVVLFLFLEARIAFWVAAGIPVAFMATFAVMLASGQTINMISLFGLIMALGIVVDDAIVIGEHAAHLQHRRGLPIDKAAAVAATRMGPPVISAMLTTVVAFMPLFIVTGIIGEIIKAIPFVVVAVLIASLIEVFFILPHHLAHSGSKPPIDNPRGFRAGFDRGFAFFRDRIFRPAVSFAVHWRYATAALAVAMLIVSVGVMASGRVNFVFFTSPEADQAWGRITMAPGTPRNQTQRMLREVERGLLAAEDNLTNGEGGLIRMAVATLGSTSSEADLGRNASDVSAEVAVELITADQRDIRMHDFLAEWRRQVETVPGLERLIIRAPTGGPPGRDVDVRLMGDDLQTLKTAAGELVKIVETIPGVSAIEEDLSYGAEERIVRLAASGRNLGFTGATVGQQVRAGVDGVVALRFPRDDAEVSVLLKLPDDEISTDHIGRLVLIGSGGDFVQLEDVATVDSRLGFSVVRRQDGFREVAITADLDGDITNTAEAVALLEETGLPELASRHGLRYRFDGRDVESGETLNDMATGGVIALVCMYIILAWVFASWSLPLAVMIMIPFGLVGAVMGHWVMGLTMTILSLFALIALAGIVINNSIILVSTIQRRREDTDNRLEAIIAGTADRLRPVLLTSFTTIAGLSTLMFERSLQAQFLIPMATTIVFGLAVTTLLVLFVVPATLAVGEDFRRVLFGRRDAKRLDATPSPDMAE